MIAIALFTHFLVDFVLQPKKLSDLKKQKIIIGNLIHGGIVLFTYFIVFVMYYSFYKPRFINEDLLLSIGLVTVFHFVIDLIKSLILKLSQSLTDDDLFIFLFDQFLHILSVLFIFGIFNEFFDVTTKSNTYFYILTLYLAVIYIGDFTIRKTFKLIKLKSYIKKEDDIKGVGSLIGRLERIIILTLFIIGQPEIILGIIGIKSIARFPEFNEDKNNDYFILGNLMSLFIAIVGYIVYFLIFKF